MWKWIWIIIKRRIWNTLNTFNFLHLEATCIIILSSQCQLFCRFRSWLETIRKPKTENYNRRSSKMYSTIQFELNLKFCLNLTLHTSNWVDLVAISRRSSWFILQFFRFNIFKFGKCSVISCSGCRPLTPSRDSSSNFEEISGMTCKIPGFVKPWQWSNFRTWIRNT